MAKRTAKEALQSARIALGKAEAQKVKAVNDIEKAKANISRYETGYILELMQAQNMSFEQLTKLIEGQSFRTVIDSKLIPELEVESETIVKSDTEEDE